MLCKNKSCKKEIDSSFLFCPYCGAPQKRRKKAEMYQRPDGLYEKSITIKGKRTVFRGKSPNEVYRKMAEYQEEQASGPLFSVVEEDWERNHWPTLSPTTVHGYRASAKRAVKQFGDYHLSEITPQEIYAYLGSLARKGYASKTVAAHLSTLSMVFDWAIQQGHAESNPAAVVHTPRGLPRSTRRAIDDKEIQAIRKAAGDPFSVFVYLCLFAGLRRGEALGLQYGDIDRKAKRIYVRRNVVYSSNRAIVKEPKTEAGVRWVPLLPELELMLPAVKSKGVFISSNRDTPFSHQEYELRWKAYRKRHSVQWTPHDLRHTFATVLYEASVPEYTTQFFMGHSDITTTRKIYTHLRQQKICSSCVADLASVFSSAERA